MTFARAVKAGLFYFALVFAAGFVLGLVRVPFLVPRLGERMAELLEMPVMLGVLVIAAHRVVRRFAPPTRGACLAIGLVALALLASAEVLLATVVQDRPLGDYLASRDPVSGSVYLAMLGLFAAMPLLVRGWQKGGVSPP
jgi:hypothetical protein